MTIDPADVLRELWNGGDPRVDQESASAIPPAVTGAIEEGVNAQFKLFRYILPSQLLAKLSDPSRHALALQARSGLAGSFDARTFCRDYITKFDQEHHRVLGGSEDPGVGNIWRSPQMDDAWLRVGRRRSAGGQALVTVLTYAQEHPEHVELLMRLTLQSIAARLAKTRIIYPRPNRISLASCEALIGTFLASRTGGRRLQTVAAALFDTIGKRFRLFEVVNVGHVNRADAARGDTADLDCSDAEGRTVLSVEVKDRQLSVHEVEDTMRVARDRGVAEVLYAIRGGVSADQEDALRQVQARQFTAGHNVYHIEFDDLMHACLMLFAESGRLAFLEAIGARLDEMGELSDRQAWQSELQQI